VSDPGGVPGLTITSTQKTLEALKLLHSLGISHGDVDCFQTKLNKNVMLRTDGEVD
jgi:hypothetical protein